MKKTLKGKYIVAWDTICEGWQCAKDENKKPILFDSRDEAVREMFDDALSMLEGRSEEELAEFNEGVTLAMIKQMKKIDKSGDAKEMEKFLNHNPNCNENNEFVIKADKYIHNRKAFFTSNGVVITGTKLK